MTAEVLKNTLSGPGKIYRDSLPSKKAYCTGLRLISFFSIAADTYPDGSGMAGNGSKSQHPAEADADDYPDERTEGEPGTVGTSPQHFNNRCRPPGRAFHTGIERHRTAVQGKFKPKNHIPARKSRCRHHPRDCADNTAEMNLFFSVVLEYTRS